MSILPCLYVRTKNVFKYGSHKCFSFIVASKISGETNNFLSINCVCKLVIQVTFNYPFDEKINSTLHTEYLAHDTSSF